MAEIKLKDPGEKPHGLSLLGLFLFYNHLSSFKSFSGDLALEAVRVEIERNVVWYGNTV